MLSMQALKEAAKVQALKWPFFGAEMHGMQRWILDGSRWFALHGMHGMHGMFIDLVKIDYIMIMINDIDSVKIDFKWCIHGV